MVNVFRTPDAVFSSWAGLEELLIRDSKRRLARKRPPSTIFPVLFNVMSSLVPVGNYLRRYHNRPLLQNALLRTPLRIGFWETASRRISS